MSSFQDLEVTPGDPVGSVAEIPTGLGARLSAYYELGKPNLSGLVVITGVIGFYLASQQLDWARLLALIVGLWLTAAGAGGVNMLLERDIDARMQRTKNRPIPSGRTTPIEALWVSVVAFSAGFSILYLGTNVVTALLSLLTAVVYLLAYTPLKKRGSVATWVGAIPGAIPPVMGWSAAEGGFGGAAMVLFGILFFWQFPHFWALAWMYREDYQRAGLDLCPGGQPGRRAAISMLIMGILLIGVSLMLQPLGRAGILYTAGALVAGIGFLVPIFRLLKTRTVKQARSVFLASITYLPVLLALVVLDRFLFE